MSENRRGTRALLVTLTASLLLAAVSGCTDSEDSGDTERVELRFSWWGSPARAQTTQKVIETFQRQHPNIRVKGESTDFNSYFDKLATQVAANTAPDVITMGGAYPAEYAKRDAILDLAKVKGSLRTDRLDPTALSSGTFDGRQYGVPTGVNTYTLVADTTVFKKAGVPLPDDEKWTWDDFVRTAEKIADKSPKGTYGVADLITTDLLDLYGRQRGESLYTADGKVGISKKTLRDLWKMTSRLREDGVTPPADLTSSIASQPAPEESLMGRGQTAMQFDWSNQLAALSQASGHHLVLLRAPGESDAEQPGMWLQASQFYTVNAASKHPREAAQFVDFLVNSVDAGKLILTDRGIPSNAAVRKAIEVGLPEEQLAQVTFIGEVTQQMGPPLIVGPSGSTDAKDILRRINDDVLFGRTKPKAASKEFFRLLDVAVRK